MNHTQRVLAASKPTITIPTRPTIAIPGKPDLDALRDLADQRLGPHRTAGYLLGRDPQEYERVHRRVAKERGPARLHRCHFCNAPQAKDWALLTSQPDERVELRTGRPRYWSPRLDAYVPACRPCHWHLDALERKLRAKANKSETNPSPAPTSAPASLPAPEATKTVEARQWGTSGQPAASESTTPGVGAA